MKAIGIFLLIFASYADAIDHTQELSFRYVPNEGDRRASRNFYTDCVV